MTSSVELSTSDITLTPGTDGVSDYQEYLEKTCRRDSQGDTSLVHSSPTGIGELQRQRSLMDASAPTLDKEIQLGDPALPVLEETRSARARNGPKKRPHVVEAAEDPHEYPGPLPLSLLTIGICLSVFLVSLDRTIVATVRASCENPGTDSSELTPFP